MRRRSDTKRLALCGVLAALAVALMFFGGVVPFASIACPVLASLVLIPVYAETGKKWSAVWFLAVAVLAVLLAPEKESAVLFAFFGYYPMLRTFLTRLRPNALRWIAKLAYCTAAGSLSPWERSSSISSSRVKRFCRMACWQIRPS